MFVRGVSVLWLLSWCSSAAAAAVAAAAVVVLLMLLSLYVAVHCDCACAILLLVVVGSFVCMLVVIVQVVYASAKFLTWFFLEVLFSFLLF